MPEEVIKNDPMNRNDQMHTRFCTDTTDFSTGTLTHLLSQGLQVDASLKRHLNGGNMCTSTERNNNLAMTHTLREWMRRMVVRASGPGGGNSIFRSIRPVRSKVRARE